MRTVIVPALDVEGAEVEGEATPQLMVLHYARHPDRGHEHEERECDRGRQQNGTPEPGKERFTDLLLLEGLPQDRKLVAALRLLHGRAVGSGIGKVLAGRDRRGIRQLGGEEKPQVDPKLPQVQQRPAVVAAIEV